jgi:N-methylhydantoinase A/oxoprolinase/acetone carboxylase beta subunit
MLRIGIDTGGTFTDLVMFAEGRMTVHKVRSTPDDPSRSIVVAIGELAGRVDDLDIVHGSTVATNAMLERKGARVALVATAGFEDVLRIGRQTRLELYNIMVEDRRPLVDADLTFGVPGRLGAGGEEQEPLDLNALDRIAATLQERHVEAVAVCFLHSYANPAHERIAVERLERAGLAVSASHRVLSEYREFERWSTTVVNAYVTPLMARYLSALEQKLGGSRLSIMQSNGGSISAATAKAAAVQTVLSGPAAGVVGAQAVAEAAGYPCAITFDMGGTSTDVALVDRAIPVTTESVVGDVPVRLPVIDIHTVGAGGGSIAFLDAGGALRVGPRSAGADPGPICYGAGTEMTVTDANLLLGRLDPEFFLAGRMRLDIERTRRHAEALAARAQVPLLALAEGIVRVANANMERAIRVVSVERGFDPREFALVAFGGAGGMHACDIASALDIRTVIAPRHAGVLSALGMLLTDVTRDYSTSVLRRSDEISLEDLGRRFGPIVDRGIGDLRAEGFDTDRIAIERAVDVRYAGQSYEITVPFGATYRSEFDRRHEKLYGYASPARPTEVVNLRVKAIGRTSKPSLPVAPRAEESPAAPTDVRPAHFAGRQHKTAFFRRDALLPGHLGRGPAVLTGGEATTVVPPGFSFRVDPYSNILMSRVTRRGSGGPAVSVAKPFRDRPARNP